MVFWPRHDHRLDRALGLLMGAAIGDALLRWSTGHDLPDPVGAAGGTRGTRSAAPTAPHAGGSRPAGAEGPDATAGRPEPNRTGPAVRAGGPALSDRASAGPDPAGRGNAAPVPAEAGPAERPERRPRSAAAATPASHRPWTAALVDGVVPGSGALQAGVPGQAVVEGARRLARTRGEPTWRNGGGVLPLLAGVPAVVLATAGRPGRAAAVAQAMAAEAQVPAIEAEACMLWTAALAGAVEFGGPRGARSGLRHGMAVLPAARRRWWRRWLVPAGRPDCGPTDGPTDGPTHDAPGDPAAAAVARAWTSWARTPVPLLRPAAGEFPCLHAATALLAAVTPAPAAGPGRRVVRGCADRQVSDVPLLIGVVAGALAGACWGLSGLPVQWQRRVRVGSTGAHGLIAVAALALSRGRVDGDGWPLAPSMTHAVRRAGPPWTVPLPADRDVFMGNLAGVRGAGGFGAVVSLCRVGAEDAPAGVGDDGRALVWMVDTPGANPNLHFVIDQAARAIAAFRAEGKRVLVHCAFGRSRTPAVAARYAALRRGVGASDALITTLAAVGGHLKNPELAHATAALGGGML